jgi:hypothetical protein
MARANSKPTYTNPTLNDEVFGFKENGEDVNIPLISIYNLVKMSTTGVPHNYICDASTFENGNFLPDSFVFNEITRFKFNNIDSYGVNMVSFFSLFESKKDDLFLKLNILGKTDFAVFKISSVDYADDTFTIWCSVYKNIQFGELTLNDNCYFEPMLEREPDFSDTQINRLKDNVYENISQTISVSPTSFEKGVSTNLTFTWRVTKNDDTLNTVTVDGVDKLNEATGVNRTYTVNNQISTKIVSLITNLTRNTVAGSTFTLTNSAGSYERIPQYFGLVADGDVPPLTYDLLNPADTTKLKKFISSSNVKTVVLGTDLPIPSNEKLFFLSTNSNAVIRDGNNFVVTSAFAKSTVTMELENGTQSITQYLLIDPVNSAGTYTITSS